ncbi:MAG: hypothetical protein KAT43_06285 [Nanoarchaeota archaeon]|nr:hypothetical protein [Nanoarchaeota archaeon]
MRILFQLLGGVGLGFSLMFGGCISTEMPIDPSQVIEKEYVYQKRGAHKEIEYSAPDYKPLPREEYSKARRTYWNISKHCASVRHEGKDFTECEELIKPIFEIFDKISGKGPNFNLDIVSSSYKADGGYYDPSDSEIVFVNKVLSINGLAHEDGHRKDLIKFSRRDYASLCRAEAVATAHTHFVADYFHHVLKLDGERIWSDELEFSDSTLYHGFQDFKSFENLYNGDTNFIEIMKKRREKGLFVRPVSLMKGFHKSPQHLVGRIMHHIILHKYKGNPKKSFEFLRSHDVKAVFKEIYKILGKKNFVNIIQESTAMANRRFTYK